MSYGISSATKAKIEELLRRNYNSPSANFTLPEADFTFYARQVEFVHLTDADTGLGHVTIYNGSSWDDTTGDVTLLDIDGNTLEADKSYPAIRYGEVDGKPIFITRIGSSSSLIVQEEGTDLPSEPKLNFIGAAITAADDPTNTRTNVTLSQSPSTSTSVVGVDRLVATGAGLSGGGDLSANRTLKAVSSPTDSATLVGTGRTITAGTGLTGGGNLSADRTIALSTPVSAGNGGTGLDGSSAANGKTLIGNGTGYTLATLTPGAGVAITNGAGSITIASTVVVYDGATFDIWTSQTDDYDLPDVGSLIVKVNSSGGVTLTGIQHGDNGRVLHLIVTEDSTGLLTLANESVGSFAANRFLLPDSLDVVLGPGDGCTLVWESVSLALKWRYADDVASSGVSLIVQEEGSDLPSEPKINFIGAALTAADDSGNTRTNVTLSQSPSTSTSVVGIDRTVSSGAGLTGGGDLSANRTLKAVSSPTDSATLVGTGRTITAGTGLTGGGDLSADRTLTVSYGTSSTTACVGNDSRLSDARTPTAHATSHQNGGSDEVATATAAANAIPKAGAGGTLAIGWLPTGSTSSTVCIGNDSRLSDARTPTSHASTHQHSGSDEVATATAGANAIPKAGAGGTLAIGWLPTGSTSSTVCIGNDSRLSDARTPTSHATSHKSGGSDSIKLDELASPTDVTTLNVSTSAHGLTPKLPNDASKYLDGTGAYTAPALPSVGSSGTTLTGVPQWIKISKTHTDFQTAATTNTITLWTAPAGIFVHAVKMKSSTQFAGTGMSNYFISLGITGATSLFLTSQSVSTAVSGTNYCTSPQAGIAAGGGTFPSHTATTAVTATAGSNVNLSNSTAGAVDFWFLVSVVT